MVRDPMRWFCWIYLILSAAPGPGVCSVSNRIVYQKYENNHASWDCSRCVELTTLPPSVSRLSRQCEILNTSQPHTPLWPVTGIVLLYLPISVRAMVRLEELDDLKKIHLSYWVSNPRPSGRRSARSFKKSEWKNNRNSPRVLRWAL
jgi:hypothetical protein